jgi:hypothetical protein
VTGTKFRSRGKVVVTISLGIALPLLACFPHFYLINISITLSSSLCFTSATSAATALLILFVIVFLCSTSLPIPSRFFDLCDPSTPGQQEVAFVLYPCSWPIRAHNLESSNPFYPCRSTYYPAAPRPPGSIIQLYLFLIRPAA